MFNKIKNYFTRSSGVEIPASLQDFFRSYNNTSGINISAESILGNSTVFRAVNLIAGNIAKIPCYIYRNTNDGREKATALTQYNLLLKSPHPLYTAYTFKHTMISNALIHGNSYAYIDRNAYATPNSLLILDPRSTSTYYDTETGILSYRCTMNNKFFNIPMEDMIHLKGLSLNGHTGLQLLDILANAYGYGLNLQRAGNNYFKNNMKPSVIIELAPHIKGEKIKEFREIWAEQQGGNNSSSPAFLTSGNKIQQYSSVNEAANLLGNLEHDIITVANCLNISPSRLGSKNNTSYSSLEMETQNFLSDIDVWLYQMEQEFEYKLLAESSKVNNTHYIEFDRSALIKIDTKTRSEVLIQEYNNGIIHFEEMREQINKNIDKDNKMEWRRPANIIIESEERKLLEEELKNAKATTTNVPVESDRPESSSNNDSTVDDSVQNQNDRLAKMTILTLDRLLERVKKSKEDVMSHRDIFVNNLSPYENAEAFTNNLLKDISSQEDKYKYIENIDAAELLHLLV